MEDTAEFCQKCGTRCSGAPESEHTEGTDPLRLVKEYGVTKSKPRIGFAVAGAFFAIVAVFTLVMGFVQHTMETGNAVGAFLWEALLCVMFWVLAYSPKTSPYLLGKDSGMKKWLLIVLCAVGGLVAGVVVMQMF